MNFMQLTTQKPWLALLLVSIVVHFAWLSYPGQVVFDEVHFGKFITAYCCTHERFFDIHPPHAKLLIAGGAYVLGYRGGFSFEHISQEYGDINVLALRFVPAAVGALIPLLLYALLRQAGVSKEVALIGGIAGLFDNGLVVQSRLIALDSILLASLLGSLCVFWLARRYGGRKQIPLYVAAGGLAGLAVGVKFTGLAALGLLGVLVLFEIIFHAFLRHWNEVTAWLARGVLILLGAAFVYVGGWWIHFSILENPGPGDAWGVPKGEFVEDVKNIHRTMYDANYNLKATHPYSSMWYTWPFMQRPVFYWQHEGGKIYFLGNPVVWWGSTILFIWAIVIAVAARMRTIKLTSRGWAFFIGFFIALLPLTRVPRALFMYHYLTPLIFSLLFGLFVLDSWFRYKGISHNQKRKVLWWSSVVIIAGFILFSPLTYGFPTEKWHIWLNWFPTWR